MPGPDVRVLDATLHALGAPVHVVVTGLERAEEVVDAVAQSGASASIEDGRLSVVGKATQLVDATGRTGGASLAEPLRERIEAAIAAWDGASPAPLATPAGPLDVAARPLVMGIVNVTPDSFSDGGAHDDEDAAVAHAERLLEEGVDIVDVGGESTRPGAEPVPVDVELERVVPVVRRLAGAGAMVSVDTSKGAVARAAVEAGAAIVNDVSAGRLDDELLPTVAELGVPYVLLHMQGTPRTMQDAPTYEDVVADVFDDLAARLHALEDAGIDRDLVLVDPGIGFGKTTTHNLALLHALRQFRSLGRPLVVGTSRKRFLGEVTGVDEADQRLVGSLASGALAVDHGADVLRVHDVAATVEAVAVARAVREARGTTSE